MVEIISGKPESNFSSSSSSGIKLNEFTETFHETRRIHKIKGAYFINLIKQLKCVRQMNGTATPIDFDSYFMETHNGFYKIAMLMNIR